jgi:hypothetical protein
MATSENTVLVGFNVQLSGTIKGRPSSDSVYRFFRCDKDLAAKGASFFHFFN